MKQLDSISEALKTSAPGTIVTIRDYVDSSGDRRDVEFELIPPGTYDAMLQEDLRLLESCDVADLAPDAGGDLTLTDIIAAREQLLKARRDGIQRRQEAKPEDAPGFHRTGPFTFRSESSPEAVYVSGRLLSPVVESPAKGAIPRAKQKLAEMLNLPTRRYVHRFKLAPGKFDEVMIYAPGGKVED